MEYKNTLNLPKTDFPMKADLPKREPLLLERWLKEDIYRCILQESRLKAKYILHDGPPYANGDIHIGHALNKILKDIIVKFKTMRGMSCAYVPGWDCHGLPVEHQLFKELKIRKHEIDQLEFRKKAHDYAMKFVEVQKDEFIRLGVFADWQNPYLTLSADYEESILLSLAKLKEKGYVYRGLKPVNWCFRCETALAEAEVEYEDHSSPSIFVKFKLDRNKIFPEDTYLLIWTTTPWTLLANVAVAVHPKFSYARIKTAQGDLIVAQERLGMLGQIGLKEHEVTGLFKGSDLEGAIYTHPFGIRKGRVVLAEYISTEEGTGLVHTAPGHGAEDFQTGVKYKLDVIMPVDQKGKFDSAQAEFSGMNVFDANKPILEKLKSLGALLAEGKLQHSYPVCWRCKNPIIFRATKQWFLKIDHDGLRGKVLDAVKNDVKWVPASGEERISTMVKSRPDWCLSRQRYWGVPIPALVCNNCKEEILDPEAIRKLARLTAAEGSNAWFSRGVEEFMPDGLKCPQCGGKEFSKGADILDVWFDSGVSHQAVLKKREGLEFPAALYLEGSDQHRGWFQSSLIPSMCIESVAPFKTVLTHGFVVDGDGRKMSKSTGNVISPLDIIKNSGADILRLWVASSDYNEDIRISALILSRLSEAYRKIRNTLRFMLSNLYDFDPRSDKTGADQMRKIDQWIIARANSLLVEKTAAAYESFEFYKAYQIIYDFCNSDLSSLYLDMAKGRLYTYAKNSFARRAAQTAIYEVLNILVRVMAPILSFTAEEVWQYMQGPENDGKFSSVHLLMWPQKAQTGPDTSCAGIEQVFEIMPQVTKALEEKRAEGVIGSSFDAKINILTNNQIRYNYLDSLKADLCEIFKVSQVLAIKSDKAGDCLIEVFPAEGKKCQRCWNYVVNVGENKQHPEICDNCISAIGGII